MAADGDVALVSQINLYLVTIKKSLDIFDLETLEKALDIVRRGVAATPVFMAMGAGVKWLDTASAKQDALEKIIELKKVMSKL